MSSTIQEPPHRHAYSVDDYYRMAETGILRSGDRVELIKGEIIDMAPIGSRHAAAVNRISQALHRVVADQAIVATQNPVRLDRYSEPQPDIALLRPREDYYASALPGGVDVLLVIEVAGSTLDYDRNTKLPLYAQHGIPEVWLVDLENRQFSIYRDPLSGSYANTQLLALLQHIRVPGLEDIAIDLSGLW
ncbi:MAG: Uma2 family endonuclease [Gammaproteobacteria bacterium]|nr:Uma2 family endonuclease [Gammaproteobacteria bacterium]